jgi:hypothetical protein
MRLLSSNQSWISYRRERIREFKSEHELPSFGCAVQGLNLSNMMQNVGREYSGKFMSVQFSFLDTTLENLICDLANKLDNIDLTF